MSDVSYKFGKVYYIYGAGDKLGEMELVTVHAETPDGGYVYAHDQSHGTYRDYKNIHNTLAQAEKYIAKNLDQVSFNAKDSVTDARAKIKKFIDSKNQYPEFDAKIAQDIKKNEAFYDQIKNAEFYHQALLALSKFQPAGIQAILTGSSYPASMALHDFASGISHKRVHDNIRKLPLSIVKRMREFAAQRNYTLSTQACITESRNYKDFIFQSAPRIDRSKERVENVIARAVDYMLADAMAYRYYKLTGNDEIFMSRSEQNKLQSLSDQDFVKKIGVDAMQKYGNAIFTVRRIEQIIKSNRDITPFIAELNKTLGGGYVNQDVIRMMFDALKSHYNKFSHNKAVTEFINRLHFYAKDKRLATQISETYGLKPAPIKANKDKVRASLRKAARKLQDGEFVSDTVILDRQLEMARKFAVIPTQETFGRIKKSVKPTVTQQKIMERFGSHQK